MAGARDRAAAGPASGAELVREREEHRVRPEERARPAAPTSRPTARASRGASRWSCDCSGQLAVRRRRAPRSSRGSRGRASGSARPEQRGQQQPLAAAVVDVVEVPVDAAARADERRDVDGAEAEERAGRAGCRRAAPRRGERSSSSPSPAAMQASVAAWTPSRSSHQSTHGSSADRARGRRPSARPPRPSGCRRRGARSVLAHRPEPEPPAVVLAVRPRRSGRARPSSV